MEISLCMIVKNEETVLGRCLNSVKDVVDEIIIVDTGSTDKTIECAKACGATVYTFEWVENFAKARNYSFSKATKDYIIWLDADDVLDERDISKFKDLKNTLDKNNSIDSVTMNYALTVNEDGEVINSLRRNRVVKKANNFKWIGSVHEYLEVGGNIIHPDITIIHKKEKEYSNRNLKIYEKMEVDKKEFSPRDLYYYANESYDNHNYEKAISLYEKFLTCENNWIEDSKGACSKLADCYNFLKDSENELKYIFKSFEYDIPRADFCCRLGFKFLNENKIDIAIYWYKLAVNSAPADLNMSLINHDTYTYLPWIQLCVCHANKGDYDSAYYSNEMAGKYKHDDLYVVHNRVFLADKVSDSAIKKANKHLNKI